MDYKWYVSMNDNTIRAAERFERAKKNLKRLERCRVQAVIELDKAQKHLNHLIGVVPNLSPRQNEVRSCLERGMSNKDIASALNISVRTVKFHIAELFNKFGYTRRAQFIAGAEQIAEVNRTEMIQ